MRLQAPHHVTAHGLTALECTCADGSVGDSELELQEIRGPQRGNYGKLGHPNREIQGHPNGKFRAAKLEIIAHRAGQYFLLAPLGSPWLPLTPPRLLLASPGSPWLPWLPLACPGAPAPPHGHSPVDLALVRCGAVRHRIELILQRCGAVRCGAT